jgi:transposase
MLKNGVKYTSEFKQQIVKRYNSGQSVANLSREYGVSTASIYKWINQLFLAKVSEDKEVTVKEYQVMKKRIAELEMENEILKKATAIFAREQ